MKVLMLTWEFPPLITGGLGMACYGMTRALLERGVSVDLLLPVSEEVYFPLRVPADVDRLPVAFFNPAKAGVREEETTIVERIMEGQSFLSAYCAIGEKIWREEHHCLSFRDAFEGPFFRYCADDHHLFTQVRNYSALAVRAARALEFDVIHAHDWLALPAALMVKKMTGAPVVWHMHATEFDRAGGPGDERIHHVEYLGGQRADRIITVSHYTARMLVERYCVDPAKIRIVHNAFTPPRNGGRKKRIFPEPTVLFVGRLTIQKGPDYFIRVARKVLDHEPNVRFIMGGRGDMEKRVLHRAASFGMGTKFLFAGFLNREEVEEVLSAADIFVMPSVSEPFGIAPLEAMSHGAVAIISNRSGVSEVIRHAFKVNFWDVDHIASIIRGLVADPGRLREMARAGMAEVSQLQWGVSAEKIEALYRAARGGA